MPALRLLPAFSQLQEHAGVFAVVAVVSDVGAIIERISQRASSVSKSVLVNLHLVNLDVNLGIG